MDRHTPTVAELVRRAAEAADPAGRDPSVAQLQVQLEDDDEPITAVENLEERLAVAAEGADYDVEDPGVAVATAVVLYLAGSGGQPDYDRDPSELIQLAVKNQWMATRRTTSPTGWRPVKGRVPARPARA